MRLVALDIETDTTPCHAPARQCCQRRGLDPEIGSVTAVSVFDGVAATVLHAGDSSEANVLTQLDMLLSKGNGVLVTWNGAVFDLPFLSDRARALGVPLGLELVSDPTVMVKYEPLPGHEGGYRARWHDFEHLDVQFAYQGYAADHGLAWSLKPVAAAMGLAPVTVDRTRMHELTRAELDAYVASDARVTWELAARQIVM